MLGISVHFWLLAQRARWERLGDRFSGDHARLSTGDSLSLLALAVGSVVGIYLLSWLARRYDENASYVSQPALFRELCRAHHVDRSGRRLLKRLAASRGVENPAMLFVNPHSLETVELTESLRGSEPQIAQLRDRLFAGLEEDTTRMVGTSGAVQ